MYLNGYCLVTKNINLIFSEWQCLSHAESDADPYDEFPDDSDISNNDYEDTFRYDVMMSGIHNDIAVSSVIFG